MIQFKVCFGLFRSNLIGEEFIGDEDEKVHISAIMQRYGLWFRVKKQNQSKTRLLATNL